MRRGLLLSALFVIGAVLAYGLGCVMIWDGWYDLTVVVSFPGERPQWVYCRAFMERTEAQWWLDQSPTAEKKQLADDWRATFSEPFEGERLKVRVRLSGRDSPLFGTWKETQIDRFLVIMGELPDGRRIGKVVDIPNHKESKEIHLSLP